MLETIGVIFLVGALAFVALATLSVCLAYFTQAQYIDREDVDWHEHDTEL